MKTLLILRLTGVQSGLNRTPAVSLFNQENAVPFKLLGYIISPVMILNWFVWSIQFNSFNRYSRADAKAAGKNNLHIFPIHFSLHTGILSD